MASAHYGNFRDPVGLLRRMLTSRDRSAYDALALAATRLAATPLDLALSGRAQRTVDAGHETSDRPLLLVVAGPRTGSTLICPRASATSSTSAISTT